MRQGRHWARSERRVEGTQAVGFFNVLASARLRALGRVQYLSPASAFFHYRGAVEFMRLGRGVDGPYQLTVDGWAAQHGERKLTYAEVSAISLK